MQGIVLVKRSTGDWIVRLANDTSLGPYLSAAFSLQIAVIELVSLRRFISANLYVKDDYGRHHVCRLIEAGLAKCLICENQWFTRNHPMPPRCSLWEALRL